MEWKLGRREGDGQHGTIFFHGGDDSGFVAKRIGAFKGPKRK